MKNLISLVLVLIINTAFYSQNFSFSNPRVTKLPTNSDKNITIELSLNSNYMKGYIYSYLSKDSNYSTDDILLGTTRLWSSTHNGTFNFKENVYQLGAVRDTYYLITKIRVYTSKGWETFWGKSVENCINTIDNSKNCSDPNKNLIL